MSDQLEGSKAYIEVKADIHQYKKVLEQATLYNIGKEEKLRIAEMKKIFKYEDQFQKLGFKKEVAKRKALAEIMVNKETQMLNELTRTRALKGERENRSGLNKLLWGKSKYGNFWSQNVIGRSLSTMFGNIAAGKVLGVGRGIHNSIGIYSDLAEKNNLSNYIGARNKNQYANLQVQTGTHWTELAGLSNSIATALNKYNLGASSPYMKLAQKLSTPFYKIENAVSDMTSFLKGGQIDTQGQFAHSIGQGKARQMNALERQQQALVDAGVYMDMSAQPLVSQRERILKTVQMRKGLGYTASDSVQFARKLDLGSELGQMSQADKLKDLAQKVLPSGMKLSDANFTSSTFQNAAIMLDPNATGLSKTLATFGLGGQALGLDKIQTRGDFNKQMNSLNSMDPLDAVKELDKKMAQLDSKGYNLNGVDNKTYGELMNKRSEYLESLKKSNEYSQYIAYMDSKTTKPTAHSLVGKKGVTMH